MRKRIVIAILILLIPCILLGINLLLSATPSTPPDRQLVQPSFSVPTSTLLVEYDGVSNRLLILNRALGIPLDQLQAMSAEQIQELIERNAELLQVNIDRLITTTPGVEVWLHIQGRKSPTPPSYPAPSSLPSQALCFSIQQGLVFLNARYNLTLGLLNESPQVAPDKYWLTNDNALAAFIFSKLGQPELSAVINTSMLRYGYNSNGLIDVVWGTPVSFPPYVGRQVMLLKVGTSEVWQELHSDGPRFEDWADYSNLGFLGALNEYQQGHVPESLSIFSNTLAQFDGTGFHDKAFNGQYETYKLALALYVGTTIHAPIPNGDALFKILKSTQAMDGGFITHYRDLNTFEGDANTETTSLALLALMAYGCGDTH